MSVVVSERNDHHELICKGAVDEMLSVCSRIRIERADGPTHAPLDEERLARVREVTRDLNEQGLRVVAVAMKALPATQSVYSVADETDLTLVGYIAFLDPPKESTEPALRALAEHGVQVKVLTGDSELIAAHVCARVGLGRDGILLGSEIEHMIDSTLASAVESHLIFARLTPHDKERIVRILRANGHVVGFMGDGINDAPALRSADIGISVDSAAVHREPCGLAADDDDAGHHGDRCHSPDEPAGGLFQIAGAAAVLLPMAGRDSAGLRHAHDGDEADLHP